MRDVTLVILNSLRIKCHIRRPLRINCLGDFLGVVLMSMYVKLCHVIPRCIELNIMPCLIIFRFVRVNARSMPLLGCCWGVFGPS